MPFSSDTETSRTDRTAISMSRVSMLTRDKKLIDLACPGFHSEKPTDFGVFDSVDRRRTESF